MEIILQELWQGVIFVLAHLWPLNCILAIIIVFFQRKDPKSVWTWLLVLFFLPVVGFVFYLLIGTDIHKQRMFRTKEIEDRLNNAIRKQERGIRKREVNWNNEVLAQYSDLILFNLETSNSILTEDNQVMVYTDGHEKFNALMEDMKNAKHFIHIQYYIIRDDELFREIKKILIKKAAEGVEVRILFDGMGCRKIRHRYWHDLEKSGIETAEFFPAFLRRFQLRLNYRNHRKIAVIDGEIAYVGGFNVGREYLGLDKRMGYWRDTHLRLRGSSVQALQCRFILDWNYCSHTTIPWNEKYLPATEEEAGKCPIQIISSGPDSRRQEIRDNYLRLITKAQKSIFIQTPYFIPDDSIMDALMIAVHSGIEVNIMIPCKPDHPFVYWATYSYVGELVMEGANCYTYEKGFLHTKGLIADEKIMCFGTANMDIRSFRLNFEVNAVIFDAEESRKMADVFREDINNSRLITKDRYRGRSILIRFKEQISRLLSPLL